MPRRSRVEAERGLRGKAEGDSLSVGWETQGRNVVLFQGSGSHPP